MKRAISTLLFLVLIAAAGCTSSGGNVDDIEIANLWGRTSPNVAQNGAFYMLVTNNSGQDDELVAVTTDACGAVELHEMYMKENDVMGMREVPDGIIPVLDGETVELKAGGLHIMCIDKMAAFDVGDKIPLTLKFANAGEIEATAEIKDSEMGSMDMDN